MGKIRYILSNHTRIYLALTNKDVINNNKFDITNVGNRNSRNKLGLSSAKLKTMIIKSKANLNFPFTEQSSSIYICMMQQHISTE